MIGLIDRTDAGPASPALPEVGRRLAGRFGDGGPALPADAAPAAWVEALTSRLPPAAACAVLEHLFGVLPLVAALFGERSAAGDALAEVAAGRWLGGLGLFTPTPEPGWAAAELDGEPGAGGWRLRGAVRLPSPLCDGALVAVRLPAGDHRLAWLDHREPGVERRGGSAEDGPCWLQIDGAAVGAGQVSRPVTPTPLDGGGELARHLAAYAGVWALAAAVYARQGVRQLRRAARTTLHRGTAYGSSQWVAMAITEVEIEADLTAAAARQHLALAPAERSAGLAVAAAAARTLSAVAARTAELRHFLGLGAGGPLDRDSAEALTAGLGGPLAVAGELARAMGIPGLNRQGAGA